MGIQTWQLACLGLAGLALPLAPARAETRLPAPGTGAWRVMTLPGVKKPTHYEPVVLDDGAGVRARSDCAAAAMMIPLDSIDLQETPWLTWRWRIERDPGVGDPRSKRGDDFAGRVYVMFRFEPEHASAWDRLRRRVAGAVYEVELPGNALNYVWSPGEPEGATWDNPFSAESRMISLGAGKPGTWRSQRVNVWNDYRSSFARNAGKVMALGLMTDADNSCSEAEAIYADFRFQNR